MNIENTFDNCPTAVGGHEHDCTKKTCTDIEVSRQIYGLKITATQQNQNDERNKKFMQMM